jgi:hypothetical protein
MMIYVVRIPMEMDMPKGMNIYILFKRTVVNVIVVFLVKWKFCFQFLLHSTTVVLTNDNIHM